MIERLWDPDVLTGLGLVTLLAALWLAYQVGRYAAERAEPRRALAAVPDRRVTP